MTIAFRVLLAFVCFLMFLDLIFSVESKRGRRNDDAQEEELKKMHAKKILSRAEDATIDVFNDIKQQALSGEQLASKRTRQGRQYIDFKTFDPMLDGMLFGDFCSRPIYQAVSSACEEVNYYTDSQAAENEITETDIASNLTSLKFSYDNKFCEDVLSLAEEGLVSFSSTERHNHYRQCAFTIFRMYDDPINLECWIPEEMNGNGVFKILAKKMGNKTEDEWQTVYTDWNKYYRGSITVIMLDNGDFIGNMGCMWSA